jgi:hypothetical protein
MELTWYPSESADGDHDDLETDFAGLGSPGGAAWAHVALEDEPGHPPWTWAVYARWLWEDIDADPDATLARGEAGSQAGAMAAVAAWAGAAMAAVIPIDRKQEQETRS